MCEEHNMFTSWGYLKPEVCSSKTTDSNKEKEQLKLKKIKVCNYAF